MFIAQGIFTTEFIKELGDLPAIAVIALLCIGTLLVANRLIGANRQTYSEENRNQGKLIEVIGDLAKTLEDFRKERASDDDSRRALANATKELTAMIEQLFGYQKTLHDKVDRILQLLIRSSDDKRDS